MKIGVDACCWGNKRGFGRFTRELLEALLKIDGENEYLFFLDNRDDEKAIPSHVKKIFVETSAAAVTAASASGSRAPRDLLAMIRAVSRQKPDVFFFPAVYSFFPVVNRTKIIVTIHDLIADRNPKLVFPNAKSKLFWKLKQNAAVWQSDLILTVSEYSKRQIAEYFNLPQSRLRVIKEAAHPIFRQLVRDEIFVRRLAQSNLKPDDKFLLYVGGISPHKNLATLVEAFAKITGTRSDLKLVLVGEYKDDPFFSSYPSVKKRIAELNLNQKVVFTGFKDGEDLVALYNAAVMLVFPSFEEGFGLPAVEAMACGTPVAASNCSSLPEVLGEAGHYFDPHDADDMAKKIKEVLTIGLLRNSMKTRGLKRASTFRWEDAACRTLKVFNELNDNKTQTRFIPQKFLSYSRKTRPVE